MPADAPTALRAGLPPAALRRDRAFSILAWCLGLIGLLLPLGIFGFLLAEGAARISWVFLTQSPSGFPLGAEGGVAPAILGSLALVGLALALALPLGVAGAVGLVEYAPEGSRWVAALRFGAECLAAVPAIVYGLFGYLAFVVMFRFQISLLSGALTLGLMMLPIILIGAEESLRGVERNLREAALSLGVSRFHAVWRVILPKALPGILAVTVLAAGHAVGSAAPVMFTASVAYAEGPPSVTAPVMTLPTHLYYVVSEGADLEQAYATALVLVAGLLFANGCAALLRRRLAR